MSGLALLLKEKGFQVWGSDLKDNYNVKILRDKGVNVFIGHKREQINPGIQLLVYSSAIKGDNVELLAAKARQIPIIKRGKLLAELSEGKKAVAVAGSHGKTTTSSLLSHLLTSLGYRPTVFVGGLPLNYTQGAWWGKDYFVIETDESDGSFLYYNPWVSIITNIDREHLDYYGDMEKLKSDFLKFAHHTQEKVFGWGDQPFIDDIISEVKGYSFGFGNHNLVRADNFRFDGEFCRFDLYIKEKPVTGIKTSLLGRHNCLNVLAAFCFFYHLGEDLEKVSRKLESFRGTKRRFQTRAQVRGVKFIDDYAHHPTEIEAVIKAAHLLKPKRLFVVLQPHRFSRVRLLQREFSRCFSQAHRVVITDIYAAAEKNTGGVTAQSLCDAAGKDHPHKIEYVSKTKLSAVLPQRLKEGDLVLALGAGDINLLMREVIDEFKKIRAGV